MPNKIISMESQKEELSSYMKTDNYNFIKNIGINKIALDINKLSIEEAKFLLDCIVYQYFSAEKVDLSGIEKGSYDSNAARYNSYFKVLSKVINSISDFKLKNIMYNLDEQIENLARNATFHYTKESLAFTMIRLLESMLIIGNDKVVKAIFNSDIDKKILVKALFRIYNKIYAIRGRSYSPPEILRPEGYESLTGPWKIQSVSKIFATILTKLLTNIRELGFDASLRNEAVRIREEDIIRLSLSQNEQKISLFRPYYIMVGQLEPKQTETIESIVHAIINVGLR